MQLAEGYKRSVRILGLVLIGYGLGLPSLRAIVESVTPPHTAVIIDNRPQATAASQRSQELTRQPKQKVQRSQINESKTRLTSRPETVSQRTDSQASEPLARGHLEIGEVITEGQWGRLQVRNLTGEEIPQISAGLRQRQNVGPNPNLYTENLTKRGYEELFQYNQTIVLVGFDQPNRDCKMPVELARVPKVPHSIIITITEDDKKRCLGLP